MDENSQDSDVEMIGSSARQPNQPRQLRQTEDSGLNNTQARSTSVDNRHETEAAGITMTDLYSLIRRVPEVTQRLIRRQGHFTGNRTTDELKETIFELGEQIAELRIEMRAQEKELKTQLRAQERTLIEKNKELRQAQQNEDKLRDVILDKAGEAKVTDNDVTEGFRRLLQDIQRTADSDLFNVENTADYSARAASTIDFSENWNHLSPSARCRYIESLLFEHTNHYFLSCRLFGLTGCKMEDEDLEMGLGLFQGLLEDLRVNEQTITDWVIKTIECTKKIDHVDRKARRVSKIMLEHFSPVLRSRGRHSDGEAREVFEKLCTDAFNLRMMMLNSREGYAVETFQQATLDEDDEFAEIVGVEGGRARDASNKVAYTLYGALTKHPKYRGEDKRVLEKAQVIMKRKEDSKIM